MTLIGDRKIAIFQIPGGVKMRIELRNTVQGVVHEEVMSEFEAANFVRWFCQGAGLPEPWST